MRMMLGVRRLLTGMLLAASMVSCAPVGLIPVTGTAHFQVKEYPLVEQSKDNPTHPEFQDWVPEAALAHRAEGNGGKLALAGVPDANTASDGSGVSQPSDDIETAAGQGEILSATIAGKPFSLFLSNGETRMKYDGNVLPNSYDQVVMGRQGELTIFNPGSNNRIVWFYALRDGLWYYIEAGVW